MVNLPSSAPPDSAVLPETKRRSIGFGLLGAGREYGIVAAFAALFLTLTFSSSVFLTKANLLNILDQNAAIGIIACAGTLVIIAGGFDLSTGAIYAMAGVVAAKAASSMDPWLALVLGVLFGGAVGVGNGILTTLGRINSFLCTLATSIIIGGLAVVISQGQLITVTRPTFSTLGDGSVLGLKYTSISWIVVAILTGIGLSRSTFGRAIYAAGGNPEAARLAGLNVGRIRAATFLISGLAAGVAGVIDASRDSTGQADVGSGLALAVIAAIVIGGTSIRGGEGAVWRSLLGVLLLALINNGFDLLGINPTYQEITQGAIILFAIAADAWSRGTRQ
jgi:ribose transport system permease protein